MERSGEELLTEDALARAVEEGYRPWSPIDDQEFLLSFGVDDLDAEIEDAPNGASSVEIAHNIVTLLKRCFDRDGELNWIGVENRFERIIRERL